MTEVLWHGRGGQGAFTAARLLGAAASLDDAAYALAFPSFGPERRGAPIRAFTKISESPIGDRSAVKQADYVIYLDETLFGEGWEAELAPGGCVFVNALEAPALAAGDARVRAIDANGISSAILGRPIPNTVFLGALAAVGVLPLGAVSRAIELYMPAKLHESNKKIVQVAYETLAEAGAGGVASSTASAPALAAAAMPDASAGESVAHESCAVAPAAAQRPSCLIPTLQHDSLDPAQFARSTCFAAGHLVDVNAGWRNERPVVNAEKCIGCLQCYLYCPDGAIFKVDAGAQTSASAGKSSTVDTGQVAQPQTAAVAIDYDFCKGCGMCVRACKFDALAMVPEGGDVK